MSLEGVLNMEEKAKIKFRNTLSRKIETFIPIDESEVKMYTCGPTVYGRAHIGNMRAYIFADIARRVLEYAGYKVRQVMNITDVGHLTSDADEGEDKLQKSAREQKTTAWEISRKYTKQFLEDSSKLNIQPVHVLCKATDHIPEQIDLLSKKVIEILDKTNQYGKTIIFCVDMAHAQAVKDKLNELKSSEEYASRVVSEDKDDLTRFRDKERVMPVVATTVDLLSTGVDIPHLENIIFMRPIASRVLFKQIIGRGSRLFEGKGFFRIIDFTNATRLIDEWDIPTEKPEPLLERIIKVSSNPGDIVADFFGGSGVTSAASQKLGRKWITCDISEDSINLIKARLLGNISVKEKGYQLPIDAY